MFDKKVPYTISVSYKLRLRSTPAACAVTDTAQKWYKKRDLLRPNPHSPAAAEAKELRRPGKLRWTNLKMLMTRSGAGKLRIGARIFVQCLFIRAC